MRESILTIPINEIFESKCGCPICRMRNMLENRTVEYIMGAAMMEPDVRIETNRLGFCKEHFDMMQKQKNRLSLALMLQTRLAEIKDAGMTPKKTPEQKRSLFAPKQTSTRKMTDLNQTCFVCEKTNWGMERLMRTFFEMYGHAEFRALLMEQEYICFPHYELLSELAPNYLQKDALTAFRKDIGELTGKYLEELYNDVSHYCSMYDYRNTGKDADWGNSKDSIERAILFLTTRK